MTSYTRKYPGGWRDKPDTSTPIDASALNHIEDGLVTLDEGAVSVGMLGTTVGTSSVSGGGVLTVNFTESPWWMRLDGSFYFSSIGQLNPSDVQAIMGVDETGTPYVTVPGSGAQSTLALINAVKGAVLQHVATTVTANGTLVANKHNPVNAVAGALSEALPTGQAEGTVLSVEKTDSSTNAVSVTGSIRGVGSSTITLVLQNESLIFMADATGSWWPFAGHKTLASLRTVLAPVTDVQSFTADSTWTKPVITGATPKLVHVRCWGPSGGSGSGARRASGTLATGGASGGAAGYTERWYNAADLPATVAINVGLAGTSGAAVTTNDTNGNPGTAGTKATSFGTSGAQYGCAAGAGNGGAGGSSAGAAAAGSAGSGQFAGAAGVASSATGGAGTGGTSNGAASASGGSGGGIATTPANTAGGAGGGISNGGFLATAGTAGGGNGSNGTAYPNGAPGSGGAGGGSNIAGAGGNGGNGAFPGGSPGGGGASLNGSNSGAGGTAANGLCIVETYF